MSLVTRYLDPAMVERLNHLQLSARRVVEGAAIGQHRSPLKGASIEFRQHRAYVPGDEPRRLDWRVLARTDRPYIKEYDEETNLRCLILLDSSGSMAYSGLAGAKFDHAAKLVAALAYLMLAQTESVGLGVFAESLTSYLAPHGGSGQLPRIIEMLERAVPRGSGRADAALHAAAERLDRRGLVIVISDLLCDVERLKRGVARLRHERHEIIVLRVLDHDEVAFPFRNWSRFRGMEGEKPHLCEPAVVRKTYLDNFHAHESALTEACRTLGAELNTYITDRPLIDWLTAFVHSRSGK